MVLNPLRTRRRVSKRISPLVIPGGIQGQNRPETLTGCHIFSDTRPTLVFIIGVCHKGFYDWRLSQQMMTTNFQVGNWLGTLVGSHQDSDTRPRLPCLLGHER